MKILKLKNLLHVVGIVFFIVLLCVACNNPCKDTNCQNGGTCNDGICDCPQGFSGGECQFDDALCENVNCYNNGVCQNGICICEAGYTGNFCQTRLPIKSITINEVTLLSFPNQNWDGTDPNPDLKLDVLFMNNIIIDGNMEFENATHNFDYRFTSGMPLHISESQFGNNFVFKVYDVDDSSNQLIGSAGISFTSNQSLNKVITLNGSNITIELKLSYAF